MKAFIKSLLPDSAYTSLYYHCRKIFSGGRFAIHGLDKKLEEYLPHSGGYFVELGAHNGVFQSNSLYFELKKGWRGTLVEPTPNLFLTCAQYRSKPGNAVFCNACVPFDFADKFVEMAYANLRTSARNLPSDIDNIDKHVEIGKNTIRPEHKNLVFGALAKTLTALLDEASAPLKIDFLSLDVEGAELAVLKGIDFDKYEFQYILIECREIAPLQDWLEKKNYQLVEKLTHHDWLFRKSIQE